MTIHYQLKFLGPVNKSDQDVQTLKSNLIEQLGLTEEEAGNLASNYPIVLKDSETKEELLSIMELLKSCGAEVDIVEFDPEAETATQEEQQPETEPAVSEVEEPISLDLELAETASQPLISGTITVESDLIDETMQIDQSHIGKVEEEKVEDSFSLNLDEKSSQTTPEEVEPQKEAKQIEAKQESTEDQPAEKEAKQDQIFADLDETANDASDDTTQEQQEAQKPPSEQEPEQQESNENNAPVEKPNTGPQFQTISNVAKAKNKKLKKASFKFMEYVLPILIGGVLIYISSLIMFPSEKSSKPLNTVKKSQDPEPATKTTETKYLKYFGHNTKDNIEIKAYLTTAGDLITNSNIEIIPPAPKALTPEDLVMNKKLDPWIDKIMIEKMRFKKTSSSEGESLIGVTKARIYINKGEERVRIVVPVAARAVFAPQTEEIKLALILKHGYNELPKDKNYEMKIGTNDSPNFFLKASVLAKPDTRPKEETEGKEAKKAEDVKDSEAKNY